MLADSAHIQKSDAEFLSRHHKAYADPLYAARDAVRTIELMTGAPYGKPFEVVPGVNVIFVDAGHILGSASVIVDCTEGGVTRRLVFSGDIGRKGLPIIRDPVPPAGAHTVIMESTYGNRDHASVAGAKDELGRVVREAAARGGRVLIPAFRRGTHAGTELRAWIDAVRAQSPALGAVWLVHGEPDAQDAFAATLTTGGYRTNCPVPGATATL